MNSNSEDLVDEFDNNFEEWNEEMLESVIGVLDDTEYVSISTSKWHSDTSIKLGNKQLAQTQMCHFN
jgi:hypothetical protein